MKIQNYNIYDVEEIDQKPWLMARQYSFVIVSFNLAYLETSW